MIVDSSAAMSILAHEDDREVFIAALSQRGAKSMSAATYLETSMVLLGRMPKSPAFAEVDAFLEAAEIAVENVTLADARAAREAFRSFGKGRHPAALNFGDCFTYALARRLDQPILCKGNDFPQTDAQLVPVGS